MAEARGSRADFFDRNNNDASAQREALAADVLAHLLAWLDSGAGSMCAIFDATNTTRERRRRVLEKALRHAGVSVRLLICIYMYIHTYIHR